MYHWDLGLRSDSKQAGLRSLRFLAPLRFAAFFKEVETVFDLLVSRAVKTGQAHAALGLGLGLGLRGTMASTRLACWRVASSLRGQKFLQSGD